MPDVKHKHSLSTLTAAVACMSNEQLGGEILAWIDDLEITDPRLRILAERLVSGPGPDAGAGEAADASRPDGNGYRHRFSASKLEAQKDTLSNHALGQEIVFWLDDLDIPASDPIYGRMRLMAERLAVEPAPAIDASPAP